MEKTQSIQKSASRLLSGRYQVLALLLSAYLLIGAGLRVVLWVAFGRHSGVTPGQLALSLPLGVINDLVEALYLFLPLTLLVAVLPPRWVSGRARRPLLIAGVGLILFSMLYVAGLEYFFFEEFDARFNLVAVDYLIYPTEVIGNIRETYPVGIISLALAGAAAVLVAALWRLLPHRAADGIHHWSRRWRIAAAHVAAVAMAVVLVPGNALAVFNNRVANELTANGAASFFAAARTNQLDYDAYYRTGDPAALRRELRASLDRDGSRLVDASTMKRHFPAQANGLGRLNIVVLAEESFGSEFVGVLGDRRGLTPNFDALSQQGLLFTNAFATGTRTVRGLEAISASFPPIPSESIVKRPGHANVETWGEVLSALGYHSSFLYGGYGTFDNMNAYFGDNGFALSDRLDIDDPKFANIWGVSDEDLFRHAIDYFDQRAAEGRPFFSIVMSTSNHKPYTFPEGIPGVPASHGGRTAGVRYADYAIGRFFEEAARHDWYRNTLFVVIADHGARVYGAAEIPLHSYRIPVLVLAPGRLAPGRVDKPFSQIDLAPTVMGMLGLEYDAPFFGEDVLHRTPGGRHLLFNHNHEVALLEDDRIAILGLNQSASTWRFVPGTDDRGRATETFEALPADPALIDLATAYFQTAYELFKREPVAGRQEARSGG